MTLSRRRWRCGTGNAWSPVADTPTSANLHRINNIPDAPTLSVFGNRNSCTLMFTCPRSRHSLGLAIDLSPQEPHCECQSCKIVQTLAKHGILSAPVLIAPDLEDLGELREEQPRPQLLGWVDVNDVVRAFIECAPRHSHNGEFRMLARHACAYRPSNTQCRCSCSGSPSACVAVAAPPSTAASAHTSRHLSTSGFRAANAAFSHCG